MSVTNTATHVHNRQFRRWSRFRRAILALAAVHAFVFVPVALLQQTTFAQPIVVNTGVSAGGSGVGCLQKDPATPPRNLRATEKDGKVILSWSPPADGSCVDTYIVDTYDPTLRSDQPVQSSSTDGTSLTVDHLGNGNVYRFKVSTYSSQASASGAAEVQASPNNRCQRVAPGNILNLRVQPGNGMAQICWDGVDNDACIDEYRVNAVKADSMFRSAAGDQPVSKGGCANITRLDNDVNYKFSVVAYSTQFGEGPVGSQTAFVGTSVAAKNGWVCKKMEGCRPGSLSMCRFVGCAGVDGWGGCRGPAMYDISFISKTVTQWCGSKCECDLSVANTFTPLSWGFTNGLTQSVSALLGANGAAGSNFVSMLGSTGQTVTQSLSSGQTLGNGLMANVAGEMMKTTAQSVSGQMADAMGAFAQSMVSSAVEGVVSNIRDTFTAAVNG